MQHHPSKRMLAHRQFVGRVGVQALQSIRVATARNAMACMRRHVIRMRARRRLGQRGIHLQCSLESPYPPSALDPIDTPDQVRTCHVVCGRERTRLIVHGALMRDCWKSERASNCDAVECPGLAPDLPFDIATVRFRYTVGGGIVIRWFRHVGECSQREVCKRVRVLPNG